MKIVMAIKNAYIKTNLIFNSNLTRFVAAGTVSVTIMHLTCQILLADREMGKSKSLLPQCFNDATDAGSS